MVNRLVAVPGRAAAHLKSFAATVVGGLLAVVAAVWMSRASLLEVAAAVCLVIAASTVGPGLAWLVAGVCLLAKALEADLPVRGRR